MKSIKIELSNELKRIKIITLADLHIGSKQCNMELVNTLVDKIKNNPDVYCVLNGDLIDNAVISSVANSYEQSCNPMQQVETILELLQPIKDKILCITSGNHEMRTNRDVGLDITKFVACALGLKERFCEDGSGIIFLSVGELNTVRTDHKGKRQVKYTIFVSHGKRGGGTLGGKINYLKQYENVVTNCDLYLGSHTHQASIFPTSTFEADVRNSTIIRRDKLFVSNGATLEYGGYGEQAVYQPQTMVYPTVELGGEKKSMVAYMEI